MRPARKTSGLAALLLFAFALVFGATQPAAADPRRQTVSPCSKVTLSLNFNGVTGANCSGGARFQSPTLLPGWAFTRASPETCQWASGDLTYAASGQPCITDLGMGVWESRTNLLLRSQSLQTPVTWAASQTVGGNAAAAPDGTVTAAAVSAAAQFNGISQNVAVASNATYDLSMYLKRSTGNTGLTLQAFDVTNSVFLSTTGKTVTNAWGRYDISFTTGATTATVQISVQDNNASGWGTWFAWGAQLEAGAFPTPYIPTTTVAVTRAADAPQFSSFTFPAAGTVLADYTMPSNPSVSRAFLYMVLDGGNSRFSARGSDVSGTQPTFVVGDGVANTSLAPNNLATGQAAKTAFSYDTTSARTGAAVNGVDSTAAAQAVAATLTAAPFYVGQGLGGNQLNSYIKRLVIVPNFYSPAQRVAATQ